MPFSVFECRAVAQNYLGWLGCGTAHPPLQFFYPLCYNRAFGFYLAVLATGRCRFSTPFLISTLAFAGIPFISSSCWAAFSAYLKEMVLVNEASKRQEFP